MPDKTNQTTHQEAAGKNTPAHHTWPSPGPLTPWSLTGGSESCGGVTRECEMPEAEAILSCSAWEQNWRFQTTHVKKNKAVSRHVFTHFTGIYWGTPAGDVWHVSGDAKALTDIHTDSSSTAAERWEEEPRGKKKDETPESKICKNVRLISLHE